MQKLRADPGLVLALGVANAQADDAKIQFLEQVVQNKVPVGHMACIGRYDYEVFVNRDVVPPLAAARPTKESFEAILRLSEKMSNKVMDQQRELVDEYISQLTGRPRSPMPSSQKISQALPEGGRTF